MNTNNFLYDYDFLKAKIEWIQISYLSLVQLVTAGGQYKKDWHPEIEKFGDYIGRFSDEIFCAFKKIYEPLDKNCDPDQIFVADLSALADFETDIKRLSSPSYEAPSDVDEILSDLGLLWAYWDICHLSKTSFAKFLWGVPEAGLDMALVKLSKNIGHLEISAMFCGERNIHRTMKGTKAKKDETDKSKGFVIAIYEHGKAVEAGTKFNRACTIIRKQFEDSRGKEGPWGIILKDQKEMPTPSLDSIERWLREAGIRDHDFKKEGRFWIKQT